jgi:hypothetical protein
VLGQERAQVMNDATLVRQLGSAQAAAQRARDLIAQMLAFARRQGSERRRVALVPVVQESLHLLRSVLPASITLDAALSGDDHNLHVDADPVQLEQVLFNLCINARDAIEGHGWIRVRLQHADGGWHCASCRRRVDRGHWVALSVADSGSGVGPETMERLFEPFFSTKEVGRGSGMGLAIVHGIVHDHGGHIDVQTRAGVGTEFRVLLPLVDLSTTIAPSVPAGVGPTTSLPHLSGRVMVVEDDPMVGDFMAELIGGWGLEVLLLRDPLAAAAWLEDSANMLDLLITDQTMPGLTGLELSQRACATPATPRSRMPPKCAAAGCAPFCASRSTSPPCMRWCSVGSRLPQPEFAPRRVGLSWKVDRRSGTRPQQAGRQRLGQRARACRARPHQGHRAQRCA